MPPQLADRPTFGNWDWAFLFFLAICAPFVPLAGAGPMRLTKPSDPSTPQPLFAIPARSVWRSRASELVPGVNVSCTSGNETTKQSPFANVTCKAGNETALPHPMQAELDRVLSNKPGDVLSLETGGNTLESLLLRPCPCPCETPSEVCCCPEDGNDETREFAWLAWDNVKRDSISPINEKSDGTENSYGLNSTAGVSAEMNQIVVKLPALTKPTLEFQPEQPPNPNDTKGVEKDSAPYDREQLAEALFSRPLSREEYYQRNWLWIRCRNRFDLRFEVGGSWPGPRGTHWHKSLERQSCGVVLNWHFKYINGQDWGDAEASFHYFWPWCGVRQAVRAAISEAKKVAQKEGRTLYIYSCPGYEDEPGYVNEAAEWDRVRAGQRPQRSGSAGGNGDTESQKGGD